MVHTALLALEDGSLFYGQSIGCNGLTVGEVVFNTAMTGYQEILTDPSYYQQMVTMTSPQIGNVGVNHEDEEANKIYASGLIIKQLPFITSNWRSQKSLKEYLQENNIVAVADIDTRRLTSILRTRGAQDGCIIAGPDLDPEKAVNAASEFPGLKGTDLAREVTTAEKYQWTERTWSLDKKNRVSPSPPSEQYKVIVYDYGVKRNMLRILVDLGCSVTVVPAATSVKDVMSEDPDGILLSNGPGDPDPCDYAINAIKELLTTGIPIFGICLGHQLLALASGAKTEKMKFGHHGANHPVQDLRDNRVLITSQNHGFAVDEASLPSVIKPTHRSLFDGSLQGISHTRVPAFGFQGHPEASPGPHDIRYLFEDFIAVMQSNKQNSRA